jgi:dTDP-4-dehydrorhamnose 3,5-epimerase
MIILETPLAGAFMIDIEPHEDERGFFARTFCQEEFETHGLDATVVQASVSFNRQRGTLRGMHYQVPPHEETKVVRCTAGGIYDVNNDLRPHSPTFTQWYAAKLSAENRTMLYIPGGLAHGFLTLADNTEVLYQMSEFYYPDAARGVRGNDPAFGIDWPFDPAAIADRDGSYPDFAS